MLTVELSYNPFLVITELKVNGKTLPTNNSLSEKIKEKRLQHWVDDFFADLSAVYNNPSQIKVNFTGTEADFDDIIASAEFFEQKNKSVHIDLNHIKISEASDTRLTKFKALIEDAKKTGPIDELRGQDFHNEYEKALDPQFDVNVLATMSSGKSTLINSILGQEILPAKNEACTATIARIHNDKTIPNQQFSARRLNEKWQTINQKVLNDWNNDTKTKIIEIKGNIPAISDLKHSALTIVDTPGPNNSRNDDHGLTTHKMLRDKEASMILYVMNATQLSTNDDKYFLTTVKKEIEQYGKEARDRFIFLVNKFDAFDPEKGEDPKGILVNVKQYLEKNGIVNPIIFPISARMTLLSRRSQSGLVLTRVEKGDLSTLQSLFVEDPAMHLLQYMNVSASVKKQAEALIAQAKESGNDAELASIHAGVPVVELVIQEYLQKYALPIKVKKATSTINKFLVNAKLEVKLKESLSKDESKLNDTSKAITKLNAMINDAERGKRFKHEIKSQPLLVDIKLQNREDEMGAKFLKIQKEIGTSLSSEKSTPEDAMKKIDEASKTAINFSNNVIVEYEKIMQESVELEQQRLLTAYKNHIGQLFHDLKVIPGLPIIDNLKAAALSISSTASFIEKHKYVKNEWYDSYTVSTSKWYNPFSWGEERTVDKYRDVKYVNLVLIKDDLLKELGVFYHKTISSSKKQIKGNADKTVEDFIKIMDEKLDVKLKEITKMVNDSLQDKEKLQTSKNDAKEKLDWINGFEKKLNNILEI
jgi:hypothetical protein